MNPFSQPDVVIYYVYVLALSSNTLLDSTSISFISSVGAEVNDRNHSDLWWPPWGIRPHGQQRTR